MTPLFAQGLVHRIFIYFIIILKDNVIKLSRQRRLFIGTQIFMMTMIIMIFCGNLNYHKNLRSK